MKLKGMATSRRSLPKFVIGRAPSVEPGLSSNKAQSEGESLVGVTGSSDDTLRGCPLPHKDYTTLANIRRMIDQCPRDPKSAAVAPLFEAE
jgi:hypothetical protein